MTLIATYRLDNRAVYVNDFRMTVRGPQRQADSSFKFIEFQERMGLFLAGNVTLWKRLIPLIHSIMDEISIDNVLDNEGPFHDILQKEVEKISSNKNTESGAIGFLIDNRSGQNVQFELTLVLGCGCIINEVETGKCTVIGSGNFIPDIENQLSTLPLDRLREDGLELGNALRNEIQCIMKKCGPTSFVKLGISPCMCISILDGSHFRVIGEEIKGESFLSTNYYNYDFTFARNSNGQIVLTDNKRKREVIVNNIDSTNTNIEDDIIDPQGLTHGDDPTELFPNSNVVYLLRQTVDPARRRVIRSIDEITFFHFGGKKICDPNYDRIGVGQINNCTPDELKRYAQLDLVYFIIKESHEAAFNDQVNERLFDHQWLCTVIEGCYAPETSHYYYSHKNHQLK